MMDQCMYRLYSNRSSSSTCDDIGMLVDELHELLQAPQQAVDTAHDVLQQLVLRIPRFFLSDAMTLYTHALNAACALDLMLYLYVGYDGPDGLYDGYDQRSMRRCSQMVDDHCS